MEGFSIDGMMNPVDIENLFLDTEETTETPLEEEEKETPENKEEKEQKDNSIEVDTDTLFDDPSESVDGEDSKDKEDTDSDKDNGTSPKNFYSSIAAALKDEGIFPDLDDDVIKKATTPEAFRDLVEQQKKAELDEITKRVNDALNYGVAPSEIKKNEDVIRYLNSLTEEQLEGKGEDADDLRRRLIYQDYVNSGYSKEKASKMVDRSFATGHDIEDAKDALESNKNFFKKSYDKLINKAKEDKEKEAAEEKSRSEALRKAILEEKKVFGDVDLDKATRQKIYDNIAKPIYKDPESGELYSAIQKYEKENHTEFMKYLGIVYTLTDGFKNLNGLVKTKVNKEVSKGLKNLERTINNSTRDSGGNLKLATNVDDTESYSHWDIDI